MAGPTERVGLLTKEQKAYLKMMGQDLISQYGELPPEILTQLIPDLDPATLEALGGMESFGQGEMGDLRRDTIMSGMRGESTYGGMDPEQIRTLIQEQYTNPAMRAFQTEIAPQIEQMYAGYGAEGAFADAIGRAAEGIGVETARGGAELFGQEWQRRFESSENAAGRRGAYAQMSEDMEMTPLKMKLAAGDIRYGNAREKSGFELWKEQRRSPYANPALGLAPLFLGTQAFAHATPAPESSGWQSALGTLTGTSMMNSMQSGMAGGGTGGPRTGVF